ncbi:single-stranded DNA-binding protein [Nocardia sp. NPDC050175]|uniref:single-stranded DNA-binding protein n=1 Tax=Nocardia sp. NPDC050175 TaxID=3364317 RepID=UPI0037BB181D
MATDPIITVSGNLVAAPELRFTAAGTPVANFTVASTPRYFDRQSNDWKDGEALFMRCNAWRMLAEHLAESLDRGSRVLVTGRLKQRNYETRDGEQRSIVELDVDDIGPSMMFATAKVTRVYNNPANGASNTASGGDDPWAAAEPREPALAGAGATDEEPPF